MAVTYIEKTVSEIMEDDSAIAALVVARIYPGNMPETITLPLIVFHKIDAPEHHDIDIAYPRFQFDCFADTLLGALALAKAVKELWQRYKGVWDGAKIKQGVYLGENNLSVGKDQPYCIAVDIKIIYDKVN